MSQAGNQRVPRQLSPHVVLLDQFEALEACADAYDRLVSELGDLGFMYDMERLRLLWPLYRDLGGDLFWLVAWDGDRMAGIAPMQVMRSDLLRGGVRRLHPFGDVRGAPSQWFNDWLVPRPEEASAVVSSFVRALHGPLSRRWDFLDLDFLVEDHAATRELARLHTTSDIEPGRAITTTIELEADFDAYRGTLDRKLLRETERCRRRLQEEHADLRLTCATALDGRAHAQIERIHRQRQQRLRELGFHRVPLYEDGMRRAAVLELLAWGERRGLARHYWLEADGQMLAFVLGFAWGRSHFLFLTAFDERYAALSPVKILMRDLLEREASEHRTLRVEVGLGINLLKRQFGTRFRSMLRVEGVNEGVMASRVRCAWSSHLRRVRRWVTRT